MPLISKINLNYKLMLPKLILYFDINKTILMTDKAGQKSLEDCLNNILA